MIRINLIPPSYLEEEQKRVLFNIINLFFGVFFFILLAMSGGFYWRSKALTKNIRNLEGEISKYAQLARELEALEATRNQIASKIDVMEQLLSDRFNYPKFLETLVMSLPSQIWLSSLLIQQAVIQGAPLQVQMQASSLSLEGIIHWISLLEANSKVSNLNLGTITNTASSETGLTVSSFQISFQYQP